MNQQDEMIAVLKVTIKLGDTEVALTLDQVRKLKGELLRLLPEPARVEYVPTYPWSKPFSPFTFYGSDTDYGKSGIWSLEGDPKGLMPKTISDVKITL